MMFGDLLLKPAKPALTSQVSGEIFASLRVFARTNKLGIAVPGNAAFFVHLPHRKHLSPDVAYYIGPRTDKDFYPQAPVLAVEIRSENDYGLQAEEELHRRRADYFQAGTEVVWDVDLQSDEVIRVYRATSPENPTIYRRGDFAEAEPALSGWSMLVDDLFDEETK
ncbi:MAG TPA: Uma2 family endonuclease [Acidobacteriota bacterium]|nr:Uma2 family endonuclease [Acidobacteriota bacterium]HMZ80602.1 Uma2 family endonuclease [Acidobacteriota bacterium]